jgi:elongation factor G
VEVTTGRPQVAYRETITEPIEVRYVHKKQTGGPGQFAEVLLRLEPRAAGEGIAFSSQVVGGAVPREFVPAVEAGIRRAALAGVVAGFPCVDFAATLLDGAFHERDSSTAAFEQAAAAALREAVLKARPVVLEPVMAVEVITPTDHVGDCIGDLNRRRGLVRGQDSRGNAAVIHADVPLKEMFGYIGDLRALSSGRAHYSMQFAHYQPAPLATADELMRR